MIRPGWASFADATTAEDVLADLDAQLDPRSQRSEGGRRHNGPDDATTSEATPVADDPRDRAANEPVHYDDEPWQGDDTQLAFFADPGESTGESTGEDGTPEEEPSDGTVQLSVRDILAKREAGEPLDLPQRAVAVDPTDSEPSAAPAAEDSLTAAFAAAAADPVDEDPDATAFYDWTIEDFDDEPPRDHGSATPGTPEPQPEAGSQPIAPEAVSPAAIVPGAPLLGVVPDLSPDHEDEPDPQVDADDAPAARRSLGRFPVEGDEPEEPWAPVPAGPATVSVVPDPDEEDESDSFDSSDEYAPVDSGDGDPEDDGPAEHEDPDDSADEADLDDDEIDDDAEATVVVPLPQEVAPDDDLLPDEPAPDEPATHEPGGFDPEADLAEDDEPYDEVDADPADESEALDDPALVGDSWGPNPPGTQEEQYWHDDDGLRWRSRDGGYIWFADDGQIWDAQNGEVLRDALTASPAVAAAALAAPEPEPADADADVDAAPDPADDPAATATMARTEEPPPTVTTPAEPRATRTRETAASGRSRRTPDAEIPEYVEYAPSGTRRRILTALWIAASVLAVVTIVWAVTSGSQSARGVAITVTGLALGSWWLLLSWAPTTVALAGSTLRVSKGRETEEFDLHDPDLDIRLGDDVESRSWKAVVTRPDGSELEIPAASVHPDEFVRIVQHHRRRM